MSAPEAFAEALLRDVVWVAARRGEAAALAGALETWAGVAAPGPLRCAEQGGRRLIWAQPGAWHAVADRGAPGVLAADIAAALGAAAMVVDRGHGFAAFRLHGAGARAVLARGCRLDLHPSACPPGFATATLLGPFDATLVHGPADGTFEMLVAATFARAFTEWLAHAGATNRETQDAR